MRRTRCLSGAQAQTLDSKSDMGQSKMGADPPDLTPGLSMRISSSQPMPPP